MEAFKANPELDGIKVKLAHDEENHSLILDQLNQTTDEIYIEEALKNYGAIAEVEILKTPLKEVSGEDSFLEGLIKALNNNNNNNNNNANNFNFKMEAI
jgi:hypothetical protein